MNVIDYSHGFRIPSDLWSNTSIPLQFKCTNHLLYSSAYEPKPEDKQIPVDLWSSPVLSLTEKVTWIAMKFFVNDDGICVMPIADLSAFVIIQDWKSVAPCISKLVALSFLDVINMDGKEVYFAHLPHENAHPKADEARRQREISYMYEVLQ